MHVQLCKTDQIEIILSTPTWFQDVRVTTLEVLACQLSDGGATTKCPSRCHTTDLVEAEFVWKHDHHCAFNYFQKSPGPTANICENHEEEVQGRQPDSSLPSYVTDPCFNEKVKGQNLKEQGSKP